MPSKLVQTSIGAVVVYLSVGSGRVTVQVSAPHGVDGWSKGEWATTDDIYDWYEPTAASHLSDWLQAVGVPVSEADRLAAELLAEFEPMREPLERAYKEMVDGRSRIGGSGGSIRSGLSPSPSWRLLPLASRFSYGSSSRRRCEGRPPRRPRSDRGRVGG